MFLNIWRGRLQQSLIDYLTTMAPSVDVFCLTEIHSTKEDVPYPIPRITVRNSEIYCHNFFELTQELLINSHVSWLSLEGERSICMPDDTERLVGVGSAIFSRATLQVIDRYAHFVNGDYGERGPDGTEPRVMQSLICTYEGDRYLLAHFHGLWTPGGKVDTLSRIKQSLRVGRVLHELQTAFAIDHTILGGDLNYDKDNQSLEILKTARAFHPTGARDLVAEYDITSTRTPWYRSYADTSVTQYADWVLTSSNIAVTGFTAPTLPAVSDHRPLILTF